MYSSGTIRELNQTGPSQAGTSSTGNLSFRAERGTEKYGSQNASPVAAKKCLETSSFTKFGKLADGHSDAVQNACMANPDYQALKRDDLHLQELSRGVWLMDNHKWALWAWERHAQETGNAQFTLVHADFHWDGGYDACYDQEKHAEVVGADLEQLRVLIEEGEWIRYDSFIAPAVVRGRFDALHFYCKQDDGMDIAIDQELLERADATQVLHTTVESLAGIAPQRPLIFDLCLDLFNRESRMEYGSDLWTDNEINDFLQVTRPLIAAASLVTVSLSFGCSGTVEDTRHLAELVVPQILAWRQAAVVI